MCGIFCVINHSGKGENNRLMYEKCCHLLKSRGPDFIGTHDIVLSDNIPALFAGSVLWTQGDKICKQPLVDISGNILLWNGDIYAGLNVGSCSDTEILLEQFINHGVVDTLCKVEGPYSFIYFDNCSKCLWFGRDPLGRISLLWSVSESSLVLSSVSSPSLSLDELPAFGLYTYNIETTEFKVKPWHHQSELNYVLPEVIKLDEPIVYKALSSVSHKSLNVDSPEVKDLIYLREFNKNCGDVTSLYNHLIYEHRQFNSCVNSLYECLNEAVKKRCNVRPPYCHDCKPDRSPNCHHPKLGILFSGGLDSTILALIADKHVPPGEAIDLYNVAFEKPSPAGPYNAPDRVTGLSSLSELQALAPNRNWNFVQIDVTRNELDSQRDLHISKLIYPLDSILDDSLGCALWFAASGKGILNGNPYISPATVVLLGMGADEMFGGYRKARRAWLDKGWSGLHVELVNGLINLPIRNLGRDNRIVSDHSRVPRFPFLDEQVVSFAYTLPPWNKCYLGRELPEGLGDKILLRLLAWKLGLKIASTLPKRALQFGSRVANSKETGKSVSDKLRQSWNLK